jgi:hypothetical protein
MVQFLRKPLSSIFCVLLTIMYENFSAYNFSTELMAAIDSSTSIPPRSLLTDRLCSYRSRRMVRFLRKPLSSVFLH